MPKIFKATDNAITTGVNTFKATDKAIGSLTSIGTSWLDVKVLTFLLFIVLISLLSLLY